MRVKGSGDKPREVQISAFGGLYGMYKMVLKQVPRGTPSGMTDLRLPPSAMPEAAVMSWKILGRIG